MTSVPAFGSHVQDAAESSAEAVGAGMAHTARSVPAAKESDREVMSVAAAGWAQRDYRARAYRQTCAPLLALAVDSSVKGIAFPSPAKIVFPPPRMIGSIVSNNSSTRSAASSDRTIVALP